METLWSVGLIALWGVVSVNLLLTLRAVSWLQQLEDASKRAVEMEELPELSVGVPAPGFRTKALLGQTMTLDDYAGRAVAFIFVSPDCPRCRHEVPGLVKLKARAKEQASVELVLVSDQGTAETHAWISEIAREEKVEVNLPILVAPRSSSEFLMSYNPRGLSPYFCYVDEQGIVQARDALGQGDWPRLKQQWEGSTTLKPSSRSLGRYR